MSDKQNEFDGELGGIVVTLHLYAMRPICPVKDDAALQSLLLLHAPAIAACMISAGLEAAGHLFQSEGGPQ